ncbi:DUF106 domain-containing protein [Candidatus Micrarchaeota archaeon]|nr:DUF106 domain-containing protein [Candidatus Micrarchaeota archaeon]
MVFEIFTGAVAFLAMLYAGTAKFIQSKLINREEVESIQKESKMLSEELKKAQESGNQKKAEEIMKKQMEFLPKMNKVMMSQFKPMFIIIGIFLALNWAVAEFNPAAQDDITIWMNDNGTGCDSVAGDRIFSACYELNNTNYGKWTATAVAFEDGTQVATNQTYFHYNPGEDKDTYVERGSGAGLNLSTEKEAYYRGETAKFTAVPAKMSQGFSLIVPIAPPSRLDVDRVQLTLSNGTYFSVDLPLTIPLLQVKTIYQPYWWFILISLITNLSLSIAMKKLGKKK